MHVLLDWVANHTAWDNPLVAEHPDWYERDWKGDLTPTPWWDWSDIVSLDYSRPGVRDYMVEAMRYWVTEVGIDGYRCDVAGFVPIEFWIRARRELDAIKPVFLLAEWESRDLHRQAFDATYAWSWAEALHAISLGHADVSALYKYYSWNESAYPRDAMRMTHVSNHDQNAWEGTQFERFGDALKPAIVLSVIGEGIPMIYNGQEAGNERRLAFFERDPIQWRQHEIGELYRTLFHLKHRTTALHNAAWGARMIRVPNSAETEALSFVRRDDSGTVFAVLNFSPLTQPLTFSDSLHHGEYTEAFNGQSVRFDDSSGLELEPWGYRVFVR
jgi:glycosidase